MGTFQRFIKPKQEELLSNISSEEFNKINYPKDSLTPQNEAKAVVMELYNYLCSSTDEKIYYLSVDHRHIAYFKQLFADAEFQFPQEIKFIKMDQLVKNTLIFFEKQPLEKEIILIERDNQNIPRQKNCFYHYKNKAQTCITRSLRRDCYTIHAILKQHGLNVEGDYVPLIFKQKESLPKTTKQRKQQQNVPTLQTTLQPILKPIQPIHQQTLQPILKPIHQPIQPILKPIQPIHQQTLQPIQPILKPNHQPTNILTPEFRNIFDEHFPNFCVHFIDFEFAYTKDNFNQINEIGISSYDLLGNKEISWYHALIHPGDYKDIMKGPITFHGIDPRNRCIPFKNISDVKNELKAYFNKYQGLKFLCVKDEEVNRGDYNCLKKLMGIIPNDVCVITHIELFEMVCNHYNVELPEEHSIVLNKTFKQLKIRQRCSFHETTEKHYHCGLGDSRATALMIMIEMKNAGILINNEEELPIVKRIPNTFNINTNNFLFINVDKYYSEDCDEYPQVSEILMTKVTFNNYQIQTCNTSTFQYLLPEDDLQSPEQSIIQNFFTQNNYPSNTMIYEHLQSIIDSGDDNQVIVFLDDWLTRIIHKLSFDTYLCIHKGKFFKQYISEINGSNDFKPPYVVNLFFDEIHDDSNSVFCEYLHQENHNKCSHWKFNNFKFIIHQLQYNYTSIKKQYKEYQKNKKLKEDMNQAEGHPTTNPSQRKRKQKRF